MSICFNISWQTHFIFNCSKKITLAEVKVYFYHDKFIAICDFFFYFQFSINSHHILYYWDGRNSTFRF